MCIHVNLYIHIRACIYIYINICSCIYTCIIYICIYIQIYVHKCTYIYVYMYICMYIHMHIYIFENAPCYAQKGKFFSSSLADTNSILNFFVCVYIHTYACQYPCIHLSIYIYTNINISIMLYISICVYMFSWTWIYVYLVPCKQDCARWSPLRLKACNVIVESSYNTCKCQRFVSGVKSWLSK